DTPPRAFTRSTAHSKLRQTASPPLALPPERPSIKARRIAGAGACANAKAGTSEVAASDFKTARRERFIAAKLLKWKPGCSDRDQAAIDVGAAQFKTAVRT